MRVWHSSYQLFPKSKLGIHKVKYRLGALLRVEFEPSLVGYADLCPYQRFKDKPIEIELQNLAKNKLSPILSRSIEYARWDAQARQENQSLYLDEEIKNHFLILNILDFEMNRLEGLQEQGYTEFKVKLGADLRMETEMVKSLVDGFRPDTRVRLDFNGSLSRENFIKWLEENKEWLRPSLDFIEDPFTYDPKEWSMIQEKYEIDLALDLVSDPLLTEARGANVIILKPAIQDPELITSKISDASKRFVLTHYMDFPVGQMFGLVCAQRLQKSGEMRLKTCGLQHQDIYEGFTFQDIIENKGPYIAPPKGPGIGFEGLLENQDWREIKRAN